MSTDAHGIVRLLAEAEAGDAKAAHAKVDASNELVGVPRLELGASCSQSRRATNCATPRQPGTLRKRIAPGGAAGQNRTDYASLFRAALYQ